MTQLFYKNCISNTYILIQETGLSGLGTEMGRNSNQLSVYANSVINAVTSCSDFFKCTCGGMDLS